MNTATRKYPFIPIPDELNGLFASISNDLSKATTSQISGQSAEEQVYGFQQFLAIMMQLQQPGDSASPDISRDEITDLGEFGLGLLSDLGELAGEQKNTNSAMTLGEIALGVGDWLMVNGGRIAILEPLVNAVASVANATADKRLLASTAEFMGRIAVSCTDVLQHDLDLGDPNRAWRLLQINRGITATRSHDPDIIKNVFDDLVNAIPHDAPQFFAEGMREMDAQDYPEFIRELMKDYYEKYSHPRGH